MGSVETNHSDGMLTKLAKSSLYANTDPHLSHVYHISTKWNPCLAHLKTDKAKTDKAYLTVCDNADFRSMNKQQEII